jgi:hypothetical protein
MKNFLKYTGFLLLGVVALAYIAFLFVLPNVVKLDGYIPMIKEIVKEQSNMDIEIKNQIISTTPILEAGVKIDDVSLNLSDGSNLLTTGNIKTKISIPALLCLTVRVSCLDIENPKINLDTNKQCTQYKVVEEIEKILNQKKDEPEVEEEESWFNPEWIKIYVPHVKITNYNMSVNDLKSNHKLVLKGDKLCLGYFNGKRAKVKTYAYLMSDDKTNVTANIKWNFFLPEVKKEELDTEDDKAEKIEIPFVNPIEIYQRYDLQTHINSKLKVSQSRDNTIKMSGFFDVDGLTLKLANYQLPKCFFHSKMSGTTVDLHTNFYVTPEEHACIVGKINYKAPSMDLALSGTKIHFNNLIIFTKAILDSCQVKNDFSNLKGQGYILANAKIKTNFKKLKSSGSIIIRDGSVINNTIGLLITGTNADLIFDENELNIKNTRTLIGGKPLTISGKIDSKSGTLLNVKTQSMPIVALYKAFAPSDIKKQINMTSGNISIDANVVGKLQKALSSLNFDLANLGLSTSDNSVKIKNGNLNLKLKCGGEEGLLDGTITNNGFVLNLPDTKSNISDKNIVVKFNNSNITLNPTVLGINANSKINIKGSIAEYMSSPKINISGDGSLYAVDLRKFLGSDITPYVDAKGILPMRFIVEGTDKRQNIVLQVLSNPKNYITPVHFKNVSGRQCVTQFIMHYKGDRFNIKDTGIFTTVNPFSANLESNMSGATPVVKLHGTVAKLNTQAPTINLFKVEIPTSLEGSVYALKRSSFNLDGDLKVYGRLAKPIMKGEFDVTNLKIPSLLVTIDKIGAKFKSHKLQLFGENILLNGSDINFSVGTGLDVQPVTTLRHLKVRSKNFNVDKVMKVSELAEKTLPKSQTSSSSAQSSSANIPLILQGGRFNFAKIQSGDIVLTNTKGGLSMSDNILYIKPLSTNVFNGKAGGDISMNLITGGMNMNLKGSDINVEKMLKESANMSDAISGTANFTMKASLCGSTYEEQMKSLKGFVHFKIKDGTLGPCGKLENMILAENIRQSKFFETTLGGIVSGLATIDTAHFQEMIGKISFKNGKAIISPITSKGNVMCIHIAGSFDLLKNEADMKVRGRLASMISNMLGPIAALNPVNLLKATPGINVAMAKAFSIFTVSITPEEMKAIPDFSKSQDDLSSTKFQIVLQGDANKPLSMIKSFKWLAVQSDIESAQNFADNMPEEYLLADPTTPEAQAAALEKAKEEAKPINKIKRKLNIGQ